MSKNPSPSFTSPLSRWRQSDLIQSPYNSPIIEPINQYGIIGDFNIHNDRDMRNGSPISPILFRRRSPIIDEEAGMNFPSTPPSRSRNVSPYNSPPQSSINFRNSPQAQARNAPPAPPSISPLLLSSNPKRKIKSNKKTDNPSSSPQKNASNPKNKKNSKNNNPKK